MVPLDVLTVGAGMYVAGRGTSGYGTVLPTLLQAREETSVNNLVFAARSSRSIRELRSRANDLAELLGVSGKIDGYPMEGEDPHAYQDALEALPEGSAVIVSTPDSSHAEIAHEAIKKGHHVLVVKPLTPTLHEAQGLVDAAQKAGVYGAVEFHKRFDPANLRLKRVLGEGLTGVTEVVLVEYTQRITVPVNRFRGWVESTNPFQYLGVHYADVIHWATGARPLRTTALGQYHVLQENGLDSPDTVQAFTEWETPKGTRFTSTMLTGWVDPEETSAASHQLVKVWGTKGHIISDQKERGIREVTAQNGIEDVNPLFCQAYPDEDTGKLRYRGYGPTSIRTFIEDVISIKSGNQAPEDFEGNRPTFRSALVSTALVEAVNTSLEDEGNWIDVVDPYKRDDLRNGAT